MVCRQIGRIGRVLWCSKSLKPDVKCGVDIYRITCITSSFEPRMFQHLLSCGALRGVHFQHRTDERRRLSGILYGRQTRQMHNTVLAQPVVRATTPASGVSARVSKRSRKLILTKERRREMCRLLWTVSDVQPSSHSDGKSEKAFDQVIR